MKVKIIGGVIVALLLIPILIAIGLAVAPLASAYAGLLGALGLALALLAALGGLRILFAKGRHAAALARAAEVMPMQNGHLIHVDDVTVLAARLLPRTLDRHYDVELVRAAVPPNLSHYHNEVHPALPLPDELLSISGPPAPAQLPAVGGSRLKQLREAGLICRSGKSIMVGTAGATPLYIELPECGFIAVAGQPRVGKSTEVKFLLAQFALMGWHFAIADPHIHKEDGLINATAPISGHAIRLAVTPEEVADLVRYVDKIGRARVAGDADRTPVLLVIDEFSNFVLRQQLPDDVLRILPAMAMEYAGVGVHGLIIGHDWSKNLLGGDLGAALRRAITHRLVLRSDQQNAEFLLPSSSLSRQAAGLQKGQALYWGAESPATIEIPWIGHEDLVYAAQGKPPRPYTPRKQLAATPAPKPPTAPLASAQPAHSAASVPPTVELPPPTVKDQIIMLLDARIGQWLTHSEMAAALGIDVGVIQTEAKELYDDGLVSRRATRRGNERIEYTANQFANAASAHKSALTA